MKKETFKSFLSSQVISKATKCWRGRTTLSRKGKGALLSEKKSEETVTNI